MPAASGGVSLTVPLDSSLVQQVDVQRDYAERSTAGKYC